MHLSSHWKVPSQISSVLLLYVVACFVTVLLAVPYVCDTLTFYCSFCTVIMFVCL